MKTTVLITLLVLTIGAFSSCSKVYPENKNRLSEIYYADSQTKLVFKYDDQGRLVSTSSKGTDTLLYNGQGQVIGYNDGIARYTFAYNTNGQIIKKTPTVTYSNSILTDTVEYSYDAKGRIIQCKSMFTDAMKVSRQSWTRTFTYNNQGNVIEYNGINTYNNQTENDKLSYDGARNPLNFSNSILFFLNERLYEALNENNPLRKDSKDATAVYSYEHTSGMLPLSQIIKFYSPSPGQAVNPVNYGSLKIVNFTFE